MFMSLHASPTCVQGSLRHASPTCVQGSLLVYILVVPTAVDPADLQPIKMRRDCTVRALPRWSPTRVLPLFRTNAHILRLPSELLSLQRSLTAVA